MNGATSIKAVQGQLRSGEITLRQAFTRFVETGSTLVEAAERTVGNGPRPEGQGASNGGLMPIFYNSLAVTTTTRCNAKCATCYQYAGPKGSDLLGRGELSVEEIARTIVEASELEVVRPRFHLGGGESFLAIENCFEPLEVARIAGFLDIHTTTNGYWARKPDQGEIICRRLRQAGLTRLEISWDYWHLPYIEPATIANCIRAGHEAGLTVMLHVLSTKSHSYEEALDLLPPDCLGLVDVVMAGPVGPIGRASEAFDPEDIHGSSSLDANCHAALVLMIDAMGEVAPCCSGLDHTGSRLSGNVRERPLASIVADMNASPLMRTLVFGGVAQLRPILEQRGLALESDYHSICHMCWSIFSDPERTEAVKAHFAELQAGGAGRMAGAELALAMMHTDAQTS